jgi:integrase
MWLKHLLYRAVKGRYIRETPAKNLPPVKAPPGRVRYLTPEERVALISNARPDLRLYIIAALQTGARRGELRELRWKDIDRWGTRAVYPAKCLNIWCARQDLNLRPAGSKPDALSN